MNILEGRCFLVSNSGVFLMIILIFGLISVSQVTAETQGQDATPAPPTAQSSSNDRNGVERFGPQYSPPGGFPSRSGSSYGSDEDGNRSRLVPWWKILLIVIGVLVGFGGCVVVGVYVCKYIIRRIRQSRQNQPGIVHDAPPQGEIAADSPGHQYYGQDQMPMTSSPQNGMPDGQVQMAPV